ncbi:MAG: restriction endonuclease [Anaerolineales bacterium]|nr:restriction endonuclease [Anaerolineales bacterium]
MDLILPILRSDFREFCVTYLVLRQINDIFTMAGFQRGEIPKGRIISGQRRTLVEEYYAKINWQSQSDADAFLKVLGHAYGQGYAGDEPRKTLRDLFERENLIVDGMNVSWKSKVSQPKKQPSVNLETLAELRNQLLNLKNLYPQQRGFAFEKFLKDLFEAHDLAPRGSFRLVGEQIDGSFQLNSNVYLLEAKWQDGQIGQGDLLVFHGKVEGKSTWSRGLFISHSGFSPDGLTAFSKGRATNIVGMSGADLYFILSGEIPLIEAIEKKARRAAETGESFVSVFDLSRG